MQDDRVQWVGGDGGQPVAAVTLGPESLSVRGRLAETTSEFVLGLHFSHPHDFWGIGNGWQLIRTADQEVAMVRDKATELDSR